MWELYLFYYLLLILSIMKRTLALGIIILSLSVSWDTESYINTANILAGKGYIVDQSSNTKNYNVGKNILRQEAIGIITKVNWLVSSGDTGYVCQNKFLDVSGKDGWVCYVAESAASNGIVNPNNARFRPKDNMTRFEAMILAFKGSCIQPIDATSSENALEQVKTIALNTGLIDSAAINLDVPVVRGEFFTYILRAQNYKEEHTDIIDPSLPGCVAFKNFTFWPISLRMPEDVEKEIEDPEVEFQESYVDHNTALRISLAIYNTEWMTDPKAIAKKWEEIGKEQFAQYNLLQDYAWKGWRMVVHTWQEENQEGKTKVYTYFTLKNGLAYAVIIALSEWVDVSSESIRNTIFNSVEVQSQQQPVAG